jgi:hypothetical protein
MINRPIYIFHDWNLNNSLFDHLIWNLSNNFDRNLPNYLLDNVNKYFFYYGSIEKCKINYLFTLRLIRLGVPQSSQL